jgi:hypothetical protein
MLSCARAGYLTATQSLPVAPPVPTPVRPSAGRLEYGSYPVGGSLPTSMYQPSQQQMFAPTPGTFTPDVYRYILLLAPHGTETYVILLLRVADACVLRLLWCLGVTPWCWVCGARLAEECSACCVFGSKGVQEERPNEALTQQYGATSQKTKSLNCTGMETCKIWRD